MTTPSRRYLDFVEDPATGRHEHLAVFIEWGSHECWPNATGSCRFMPPHNGKGYSFLPDTVTVLSAENDAPFIYYGGRLGDPKSIMRHNAWWIDEPGTVYIPDSKRTDRNPYQQLGALLWPPWPHQGVNGVQHTQDGHQIP